MTKDYLAVIRDSNRGVMDYERMKIIKFHNANVFQNNIHLHALEFQINISATRIRLVNNRTYQILAKNKRKIRAYLRKHNMELRVRRNEYVTSNKK